MRARVSVAGVALVLLGGVRESIGLDLQEYAVDREASHVYVVTHKAGLLSFLGHEHALVPRAWTAELCLADPPPAGAHGALVIQTGSLVIDSDSARALAGLGNGPGQGDIREIQARVLDSDHLAANKHPEIRLEAVAVEPEAGGRLAVQGSVTIRGITREVELHVEVGRPGDGALRLSGSLPIRQRDFGIEPESIGGVVRVADEVDLHFVLTALPTGRACSAAETL